MFSATQPMIIITINNLQISKNNRKSCKMFPLRSRLNHHRQEEEEEDEDNFYVGHNVNS